MKVAIYGRSLAKPTAYPGLACSVEKMSWNAIGGPDRATIRAEGRGLGTQPVSQLLRCGVNVSDENGLAWWGFVDQVELHCGGSVFVYDLGGMANHVAVRWRDESPVAGGSAGWQWQTLYADDLNSQAQYGIKELVVNMGEGRAADAGSLRDTTLAKVKQPVAKVRSSPTGAPRASGQKEPNPGPTPSGAPRVSLKGRESEQPYVILTCRGWWWSLDWRSYAEARGYEGNPDGGTLQAVGNAATSLYLAQRFQLTSAAWTAKEIWLKAKTVGAPADNLTAQIEVEVSSLPGGVVASGTLAASGMTDTLSWRGFRFGGSVYLAAATNYWITILRSGAADAANYYQVGLDEGLHYPRGLFKVYNSGWVNRIPDADLVFSVLGEEATSIQIGNIGASVAGQFLAGVMIKDASGINSRLFRAGKRSALKEAIDLLAMGTSAGGRLLASVTAERVLVIKAAPSQSVVDLVVDGSGGLRFRDGRMIKGSDRPVGRWARLQGLPPTGGDVGPSGLVWVEKAEWNQSDGLVKIKE